MSRVTKVEPFADNPRKILRPAGLVEEVYSRLRSDITSLRLPPNLRVSVDRLARELGVSQTPVREALSMLEADGFLIKKQFVGYCTPPRMDRTQLDDLFEFRLLVEPHLAKRAAGSISDEALAQLTEIAHTKTLAHDIFAKLDAEFHRLIAEQAGNKLLADSLDRLHIHIHIFRSCFRVEIAQQAIREHLKIWKAIASRDEEAAGDAMREHINRSYKRLSKFVE